MTTRLFQSSRLFIMVVSLFICASLFLFTIWHGKKTNSNVNSPANTEEKFSEQTALLSPPNGDLKTPVAENFLEKQQRVSKNYGQIPLHFEPNFGQADSQVQFTARGKGYNLFANAKGATIVLSQNSVSASPKKQAMENGQIKENIVKQTPVKLNLVGADEKATGNGVNELAGKTNYFLGSDSQKWRTDIPNYERVRYREIYGGIDLEYYGNQRQLEYDFIVKPQADPELIKLCFDGVNKPSVNSQGELILKTELGDLKQKKPIIYQEYEGERREVAGGYKIVGDEVGFWLGEYDRSKTLVIDPIIVYATYQGGAGADFGESVTVDSQGNAYITGYTNGAFPVVNSTQSHAGNYDVFVSKLNALGTDFIYTTYLGGGENDYGQEIAVDNQGNAYVTGNTGSSNFPTSNARQQSNNGDNDAFVTKLNAAGNQLVFSTYHGGNKYDYASGIALDNAGNIYISGGTDSTSLFPLKIAGQSNNNGSFDAFVSKFNNSGSELLYSTYDGDGNYNTSFDIAVNAETGSAYITGYIQYLSGTDLGTKKGFVKEFYLTGNTIQITSSAMFGAFNTQTQGNSITICKSQYSSDVCITGTTNSSEFFSTPGASQTQFSGETDAFIAKFTKIVSLSPTVNSYAFVGINITYLGGSGADSGNAIAADAAGDVYVTGTTNSVNFPQVNAIQSSISGGSDTFIVKTAFSPHTNPGYQNANFSYHINRILFSSYYGGTNNEEGRGIALDSNNNVYAVGTTASSNFGTVNASQPLIGGNSDAYIFKTGNITLPPYYRVSGKVLDANGQGIRDIQIKATGEENFETKTDANGNYYFDLLQNRNYSVNLLYQYENHTLSPSSGYTFQPLTSNKTNQNFTLTVSNDNFANAAEITGNEGSKGLSNVAASRENGEPNHGEKTVWYKWRATSSQRITFRANRGSKVTVYTGTNLSNLTSVGTRGSGINYSVTVQTTANTEYKIVVSGGTLNQILLNWSEYIIISGGVNAPYNVTPIVIQVTGPVSPYGNYFRFDNLPYPSVNGSVYSSGSYGIQVSPGFDRTVLIGGGYAPGCPVWSPQPYNFPNLTTDAEASFAGVHNPGCLNFTTKVFTGLFATNSSIAPVVNFNQNIDVTAQASGGTGEYIAESPALPTSPLVGSISHPNYAFTQQSSISTTQTAATYQFSARLKDSCTYQFNSSSLPISANGDTGTITITPTGNNCQRLITNSSWITASVTGNTINYTIGANPDSASRTGFIKIGETNSLTVTQAGSPSRFSIEDYLSNEGDVGTSAFNFTVRRIGNINAAASVNYSTADGTAVGGQDYQALTNQTVNFAANESVKTVTVQINGDTVFEPNESFTVNLSNPGGNAVIDRATATGGIVNDDANVTNPMPSVSSLSRTSATAGDEGFTLSINGGGFVADSEVKWGTTTLPNRTVVSNSQIDVPIPATLLQTAGTFQITVINPAPGGGTSNPPATFTVNACTYQISPPNTQQPIAATGGSSSFNMATAAGCQWMAVANDSWVTLTPPTTGNGNREILFNVSANSGAARTGTISVGNQIFTINQQAATVTPPRSTAFDYDGDHKSDISVFRPSNGVWYIQQSTDGFKGVAFGYGTDIPTPGDFDGDNKTDVAVFRPATGAWYLLNSSSNTFVGKNFGQNGDIPLPGDFDGDGKDDINVFRPSNGAWYRLNSSTGEFFGISFGQNGDKPLAANFDGDNKADIAVFRPEIGAFYWLESSTGAFKGVGFGYGTDVPVPADFDGDGKTDVSVFRPSNGAWYRFNSSDGAFVADIFGQSGDVPVACDYDGDSKADIAVFRPSNGAWYLSQSQNGFSGSIFGVDGDQPIPSSFVR